MTNKFKEAKQLYKQYRALLRDITEEDVKGLFDEVFEKHPEFRAIGWTQYVPSFNDGEPCEFTINRDFQVVLNQDDWHDVTDEEILEHQVQEFDWPHMNETLENEVSEAFEMISSDIAETLFGADVQVIITRSKIATKSYNCGY